MVETIWEKEDVNGIDSSSSLECQTILEVLYETFFGDRAGEADVLSNGANDFPVVFHLAKE